MSRRINAAVVKSLGETPVYESIDLAAATGDEIEVEVLAAGIHRLVRSIVSGQHYVKPKTMPIVAGIDGVGRLSNGKKVYFLNMNSPSGSMGEYTNVNRELTIDLPDSADPIQFAAIMNAGLGSWVALHQRAKLQANETVLILGVTGSSGQLAAKSARLLGAKRVIGAGRNTSLLDQLVKEGTIDTSIVLTDDHGNFRENVENEAANVDIVIDYLWGQPTEITMAGIQSARKDPSQRLRWIQVGQLAGATIQCSAALLRSKNIEISGSGIGPVSLKEMLRSLEHMVPMVIDGKLATEVLTVSLKDIENKWKETADAKQRVVVLVKQS